MAAVKHLIFDPSVVLDLWLDERSSSATAELFATAASGGHRLWLAASSLASLDRAARRAFEQRGLAADAVAEVVRGLVEELLGRVAILSLHGFEQPAIYRLARDIEQAQVAGAARSLAGQPLCLVTEDADFDALGEVPCRTPAQALAWLGEASPDAPVPFVDLAAQQALLRGPLEQGIERVLRHGQYVLGPEVAELEARLADYVGVRHCVTASSGTDTLLIAMMALGIGPGDEVVTTPFTFIATGEMIALIGATPVFVDIDARTYNLDPARLEAAITPRTKAILPVSLYGQCADMDAINAIAARHGLPVIEDAAQSFGATYKGRRSGGLSTIGSTSFFPSKPLGGYGDGGALFTDDEALARAMRELRVHGQDCRYHHPRIGINGRLDTLQAAVLLAKLGRFDEEVGLRQRVAQRYDRLLAATPAVTAPVIAPYNTSVYAQYTIEVADREALAAALGAAGLPSAIHYPVPLHRQPAFASYGCADQALPVAEAAARRVLSLPMHADLDEQAQRRIVAAIAAAVSTERL